MKRLYQRLILLLRGLSIRLRLTLLILTLILLSLLATVVCYFSPPVHDRVVSRQSGKCACSDWKKY